MGTVTIATFMTLDGIMQAPGGPDEDRDGGFEHGGWSFPYFSEDMGEVIGEAFANAECFLLGRKTYEIFAASWPNFPDKDDPVASKLNNLPKYVVSTTLDKAEWQPTTIIKGDIASEVAKLKDQYAGEIQVHGSAEAVVSCPAPRKVISSSRISSSVSRAPLSGSRAPTSSASRMSWGRPGSA
jgi:dihydrofolate reductase